MACLLQDQVVPVEGPDMTFSVPLHWERQSSCVQVFQVRPEADEWKACEEKLCQCL